MGSVHQLSEVQATRRPRLAALDLLGGISDAASSVCEVASVGAGHLVANAKIVAIGAAIAHAAEKVASECSGLNRREAQQIRGLCELMREQAGASDAAKVEALAASIARTADRIAERLR